MEKSEILKRAKAFLDEVGDIKKDLERERRELVSGIGKDIASVIKPALLEIAQSSKITKEDLREAFSNLTIEMPPINLPAPEVNIPRPHVTVTMPPVKIPEIKFPEIKFPEQREFPNKMGVSLVDVHNKNPVPVILTDNKGNPYVATIGGGSGPRVIQDILTAGGQSTSDESNRAMRVNIVAGASNTQYNDSATPDQSGGILTLVGVYDGTGSVFSLRNGSGVSDKALRVVHATDVAASVSATQIGTWNIGTVTGITNSVAVSIIDSTGVAFEGANGLPITGTLTAVTNITNSVAASLIDSTGVGYSGSNPLPIVGPVVVTSITNTTAVVGDIASYIADNESNPVKIGGIARTTNPTKASDGNRVTHSFDAVGRALIRPVQVRGLLQTAYVSISTGTETTLLAGVASTFLDLVYLMATNSSDAAVTVDIRAATAAGIVTSVRVPANSTAGLSLPIPIPQDVAADTWTADLPDITGTTVTIGALFSKEV